MHLCGREFVAAIIARIAKALRSEPSLSRRASSLRVCQRMQWQTANGRWKEVSCRKALLELHRRKLITLPAAEKSCFNRSRRKRSTDLRMDVPEVQCTLKGLGERSIVAICSRYSKLSRVWNGLMERFRYLGKGRLCGAQIRYLIESSCHGWVGAVAFEGAEQVHRVDGGASI